MSDDNSTSLVNLGNFSKPANTLIQKVSSAIGGVFEPWQIKRVAKAEAEEIEVRANLEKRDPADYEGLAALAARASELATKRDQLEASWLAESENRA